MWNHLHHRGHFCYISETVNYHYFNWSVSCNWILTETMSTHTMNLSASIIMIILFHQKDELHRSGQSLVECLMTFIQFLMQYHTLFYRKCTIIKICLKLLLLCWFILSYGVSIIPHIVKTVTYGNEMIVFWKCYANLGGFSWLTL